MHQFHLWSAPYCLKSIRHRNFSAEFKQKALCINLLWGENINNNNINKKKNNIHVREMFRLRLGHQLTQQNYYIVPGSYVDSDSLCIEAIAAQFFHIKYSE